MTDKSLVKVVHTERWDDYMIEVMITRFGDLAVFVYFDWGLVWQGDNIIAAREWILGAHQDFS